MLRDAIDDIEGGCGVSSYYYCPKCEKSVDPAWSPTRTILNYLGEHHQLKRSVCPDCGAVVEVKTS
jgi:rubrerythrin